MTDNLIGDYRYDDATGHPHLVDYVWEPVFKILAERFPRPTRLFEVGCGNGSFADMLRKRGWQVSGVDPSRPGIAIANANYPDVRLEVGNAYEALSDRFGRFPVVVSLEVVEHCYYPRLFAKTAFDLLDDGGIAIISTPYHGYLKNLALAVTGMMEAHFHALLDGGHIKFWSMKTLTILLEEAGFESIEFERVGRIAPLARSMIAIATKGRSSSKAAPGVQQAEQSSRT